MDNEIKKFEAGKPYTHEAFKDIFVVCMYANRVPAGSDVIFQYWNRGQCGAPFLITNKMGLAIQMSHLIPSLDGWRVYES
jgi:hypothetical protein